MTIHAIKPVYWIAGSKKDLLALPALVVDVFGYGLHLAQIGKKHESSKPLQGFGSAGVLEIAHDWKGDTFRAVYTVEFAECVIVLHVVQKKSKRGVETPKPDIALIKSRLKLAEKLAKELTS